jgi:nitrite reductase/ring-hydroxylating ferredoxin subunit
LAESCFSIRIRDIRRLDPALSNLARVKVAQRAEIKENGGKELNVNGTRVALFHANGKYYAIEALCRHQDGSLAPGKIDGEVVECPLHSWHYNIRTGELLDYMEGVKLTTYKVDVQGNDIYIDV